MPPDGLCQTKGRFQARLVRGGVGGIAKILTLREIAFGADGSDPDHYDDICKHLLVYDLHSNTLVCCARLLTLQGGWEIGRSYSAQYYDLTALTEFHGGMGELGRFCTHPKWSDPDILRVAWAALASYVDENNIQMLFGCSSFAGIETDPYLDVFASLKAHHLAPEQWRPSEKAPNVFRYAAQDLRKPDVKQALRLMPPLLRMYLLMGGWVSDHAVVDQQMNTLHVFTGLEIKAIPNGRKRFLRSKSVGI
jgi:putative hemolysin